MPCLTEGGDAYEKCEHDDIGHGRGDVDDLSGGFDAPDQDEEYDQPAEQETESQVPPNVAQFVDAVRNVQYKIPRTEYTYGQNLELILLKHSCSFKEKLSWKKTFFYFKNHFFICCSTVKHDIPVNISVKKPNTSTRRNKYLYTLVFICNKQPYYIHSENRI